LKNEYGAEIVSQVDGPGGRRWILRARGKEFELRHDDGYGNYLLASSPASEEIVYQIGKELENRLKNI